MYWKSRGSCMGSETLQNTYESLDITFWFLVIFSEEAGEQAKTS